MKKPHLITYVFLFFTFAITAQTIERQFIGVAGENDSGKKISLDWTLGEPFTAFDNVSFGFSKEGFLQPRILEKTQIEPGSEIIFEFSDQFSAKIFPNPFEETFTFQISQAQEQDNQLTISDYSGQTLMNKTLPAGSLKLEWAMNDYPTGLYFLQIADDSGKLIHRFKLLKI